MTQHGSEAWSLGQLFETIRPIIWDFKTGKCWISFLSQFLTIIFIIKLWSEPKSQMWVDWNTSEKRSMIWLPLQRCNCCSFHCQRRHMNISLSFTAWQPVQYNSSRGRCLVTEWWRTEQIGNTGCEHKSLCWGHRHFNILCQINWRPYTSCTGFSSRISNKMTDINLSTDAITRAL